MCESLQSLAYALNTLKLPYLKERSASRARVFVSLGNQESLFSEACDTRYVRKRPMATVGIFTIYMSSFFD